MAKKKKKTRAKKSVDALTQESTKVIDSVVKNSKQRSFLIKLWPFVALSIAHLIWGANFVIAKITLQEFPPMSLAFFRFSLAFLLMLPFFLTDQPKARKIDIADLPKLTLIGLLMISLNIAFFYLGLAKTTATDASILTMVIPILAVLFVWWFLKEKIYTINLIGILLGLVGAIIIIGTPFLLLGFSMSWNKIVGDVLIIFSGVAWVLGAVLSKGILQKYSTLTVTTFMFLVGTVTFLLPAIQDYLNNPAWITHLSLVGITGFLYISILSSIVAYFLFEWSILKLGVVKADLFQYIEPIIATTIAVLVLNEYLRIHFIFGAILIGIGVYFGTLGKTHLHHIHHHLHRR